MYNEAKKDWIYIFIIMINKCCACGATFYVAQILLLLLVFQDLSYEVFGYGSMSSISISYGEHGPAFCGLKSDGSHQVTCSGSNPTIVSGAPTHFPFIGLTAGDGFICGLLMESNRPYCWGNSSYIHIGVPRGMFNGSEYLDISAGDHHLCALRKPLMGRLRNISLVDCWGYNMTRNNVFDGQIQSISAGSEFNCGLFSQNRSVFCWGDESNNRVITNIPRGLRFRSISAGGYHVCGLLEGDSKAFCWGRSLDNEAVEVSIAGSGQLSVDIAPPDSMIAVVGARFHACGLRSYDRRVVCWGTSIPGSTLPPSSVKFYEIAAGDYFTCGVLLQTALSTTCWGHGFPTSPPLPLPPGYCKLTPCTPGFYELSNPTTPCEPGSHICLPCTNGCLDEMYQVVDCTSTSDRQCAYNCSSCISVDCFSKCSTTNDANAKSEQFWSVQLPVIAAEVVFAIFLVFVVSFTSVLYVRYKLRLCRCSDKNLRSKRSSGGNGSSLQSENGKIRPELDELKFQRAHMFTYEELERATEGFKEDSIVGKGSFSSVFKGVLKDGTVVAVKRATMSTDMKKYSNEFHTELDLLSRLNHAHLLNLLGYCEEGEERLLVYEYMANGSLHQHLHGQNTTLKGQLDWVKRVTIAVQAARGIEYLHGYACPPVIHRDIKSSNILIDEDHNARVSDFGLSLFGPASSSSPLAELPAGTLGYLDPEYYRLHYLTTKSDVYSFGVLLLEILSGRKAIDLHFEEGNIVEWGVPIIKAGDVHAILDPSIDPPSDPEALRRIVNVACRCVRMRGKERPSMDTVTTALEQALASLMGSPSNEQPILPTEVVLGITRMHKKTSQISSNISTSETDVPDTDDNRRFEHRAPSWITFPSVASSQRRKSSVSEADIVDVKNQEVRNTSGRGLAGGGGGGGGGGDGLESLKEEITPQEQLFLLHNF